MTRLAAAFWMMLVLMALGETSTAAPAVTQQKTPAGPMTGMEFLRRCGATELSKGASNMATMSWCSAYVRAVSDTAYMSTHIRWLEQGMSESDRMARASRELWCTGGQIEFSLFAMISAGIEDIARDDPGQLSAPAWMLIVGMLKRSFPCR